MTDESTVTYQVYVQGRIDPDWPGRLEDRVIASGQARQGSSERGNSLNR